MSRAAEQFHFRAEHRQKIPKRRRRRGELAAIARTNNTNSVEQAQGRDTFRGRNRPCWWRKTFLKISINECPT